jgi:hypothetical protein
MTKKEIEERLKELNSIEDKDEIRYLNMQLERIINNG